MSLFSGRTERWAERLSFLVVSSANQRSTRFSQLLEVGEKCSLKRGCASSQMTFGHVPTRSISTVAA
jgi:hypothetical protein